MTNEQLNQYYSKDADKKAHPIIIGGMHKS